MNGMLKTHYNRVRELAADCAVLLKSNGSFPVREGEKIALYGSGARHTLRGGTGGGIVEVKEYATVEEEQFHAGFIISTNG